MSKGTHPVVLGLGGLFAAVGLPLLVFLAWQKAPTFDPYDQSFFTKTYVEPYAGMPDEIRIAGWVFVGIGALLVVEPVIVALRGKLEGKHALLMVWLGALTAAFGGAFFAAADSAEHRIEEELAHETRSA